LPHTKLAHNEEKSACLLRDDKTLLDKWHSPPPNWI
jgi:hypothetical protein